MPAYIVSPEAEDDLAGIWVYYAREASVTTADRLEAELLDAIANLAKVPGMGHRRRDLTDADVFFFTLYQFLIVHRRTSPLQVVAVIHGKRDVSHLLERRFEPR